ncbi:hypothetical protein [Marimonas lutisalis]|uniref:hypothetical protein n=1 Tax=Marimonas lutisalis TaxID=2545756 RepID=UPI0010F9E878|nr:hypothetical protein [Marimonas lutisalis]
MIFLDALPGRSCEVRDFDPDDDILVIALPDTVLARAEPRLVLHRHPALDCFDVTVITTRTGPRYHLRLPGVRHVTADAVAIISLTDGDSLMHGRQSEDTATPTGNGLYPSTRMPAGDATQDPADMVFDYTHDWRHDGPPPERFFDLSHPGSSLTLRLAPVSGGPIYAVRFNEKSGTNGSRDLHASIVLVQTPPGSDPLTSGELARRFASSLGAPDFRAIAWIWLGNGGYYTDPETGKRHTFGHINDSPALSISGAIAGSVEIDR